jgi:hypothetical protein
MASRMEAKLKDVAEKGYIEYGRATSLMSYFAVDKANGLDIRMVYNGTRCGLNDVIWAPWFLLPNAEDLVESVEPGTYMGDNDAGEMFLNYILHEDLKELTGIDVTQFLGKTNEETGKRVKLIYRWTRNAMGLKPSPYLSIQAFSWMFEVLFGDRLDENNVFRWKNLVLNLPGDPKYDPSKSWVRKERADGSLASECLVYVDDMRPTGSSPTECWKAGQRVASVSAYHGLQDASRKR